jgi:lipoate-protein ligase A
MIWELIQNSTNTGQFNMDFDVQLARNCEDGKGYFRLYQWDPYCISLGANQSFDDINSDETFSKNIDVVKRPTGGRAILHAEEITYSVILPTNSGITPKDLYREISCALIAGLELYNPKLKDLTLESDQPHFPSLLNSDKGKLCFGSTARNEIKYNG